MGIDDQNILIELVYNNMHGMGIGKIHGGDKLGSLEREKDGGGGGKIVVVTSPMIFLAKLTTDDGD
jgi:hypothetical protein